MRHATTDPLDRPSHPGCTCGGNGCRKRDRWSWVILAGLLALLLGFAAFLRATSDAARNPAPPGAEHTSTK